MATTAEDLIVNIKAKTDQALRDTKALSKELDKLDEGAQVPITVKGGRDLDEVFSKLDRLSAEDATVVVGIEMAKAQRDLKDLLYDISRLDAEDATIEVKAEQVAQVRGDLEQLEAKVKQLNDLPVEPGRGGDPGGGMRKIVDGADQANSAVSNMVGNASQDLGELTGVSGSAGVALGQLAEYFSDTAFAAKAAGQSMGAAFKSFALASLPIAGISIALGVISSIVEKSGEMGRAINEASKLAVSSLLDVAEAGEELGAGLDDVAESAVTKIFEELGSKTPGVVDALEGLGITWDEVTQGFRDGSGDLADMLALWDQFQLGVSLYGNRQAKLDFADRMGLSKDDAEAMLDRLGKVNDAFGDAFDVQAKANEAGRAAGEYRADSADAAAASEKEAAEAAAEGADELERQRAEAEQLAQQLAEYVISITQANSALDQLASTFSMMGMRADALGALFDLGNAPLDMAGQVRDISLAIDDLSEAAKGIDLSAPLDPSNVKADALLDALDQLRPQIQTKITEAFSTGGPEAATAMANSYIDQVVAELGGKLTREEVAQLLGLENIEAVVAVAIEQSSIESARRQLAILVGVGGETPYTASIALALEAGTITGEQAQALVQAQLGDAGVTIPSELQVPTTAAALAEANAALKGTPATVPTEADLSGAEDDVHGFASGRQPEATVPVDADPTDAERERGRFVDATNRTEPTINVKSSVVQALITMAIINAVAQAMAPTVNIGSDISDVMGDLRSIGQQRPRVPVEAFLQDYPTAAEIARAIGTVRVPVVAETQRLTGSRTG